jgi:hypothetical protein
LAGGLSDDQRALAKGCLGAKSEKTYGHQDQVSSTPTNCGPGSKICAM